MRRILPLAAMAAMAAFAATPALAHVGGQAGGFAAGFVHPFTGLDHLLAMVAVGLWAGLASPARPWLWPASFLGFMLLGFAVGVGGAPISGAEALIGASVVALGAAVAANWRAAAAVGAILVGAFAVAHGYAHGLERPAGGSAEGFAAGFLAATSVLHLAGYLLSCAARRPEARGAARFAGLGIATLGLALAWGG